MDAELKSKIANQIEAYAAKYRYRPLPKKLKDEAYSSYALGYNGFDVVGKTPCIGGVRVAKGFERLVVGDYGPYLEFTEDQLLIKEVLEIPSGQTWRLDSEYIKRLGLSIKYIWYQYGKVKVYHQLATVKYADYRPGYFYISTLDFD